MAKCENCGKQVTKRRKGLYKLKGKMICKECQTESYNENFSKMCDIISHI